MRVCRCESAGLFFSLRRCLTGEACDYVVLGAVQLSFVSSEGWVGLMREGSVVFLAVLTL